MTERIAVLGGGAVGVTAARDVAADGAAVTLYERGDLASGASGRAAGIVYDAVAGEVDVAVADRALERFRDLDADGAIDFTDCPYVWFARAGDERRADAIRESVERMRVHDRDVGLLGADELRDRFPALDIDVEVAAVAHDAGYLDPERYVRAMGERARTAGATVRTNASASLDRDDAGPVVETDEGREGFDAVLVAVGAHTKRVLSDAGVAIPMKPYRVQALTTGPVACADELPMAYDATERYYFRPHGEGLLVGDGTEKRELDPDDYDRTADPPFVEASRDRLRRDLGVEPAVDRAWAGLCTATPDRDPLLGAVSESVSVATGWHGSGVMRAPATGERVAAALLGGEGIERFDPKRFDGGEEFAVLEGMTVED